MLDCVMIEIMIIYLVLNLHIISLFVLTVHVINKGSAIDFGSQAHVASLQQLMCWYNNV